MKGSPARFRGSRGQTVKKTVGDLIAEAYSVTGSARHNRTAILYDLLLNFGFYIFVHVGLGQISSLRALKNVLKPFPGRTFQGLFTRNAPECSQGPQTGEISQFLTGFRVLSKMVKIDQNG